MSLTNILLTIIVIILAGAGIAYFVKKNKNAEIEEEIEKDEKTYTLEAMRDYVKKRLDEITKVNLYDIGLSEEELKRRKNKKYALKKALKGCTYGDVNDKRYVKELISDLLSKEYGVNEANISSSIPFDMPSLLTSQDKFDILIYVYKKEFGYEALTQLIKRYNLAILKYIQGETKPCYVITDDEIDEIYENEKIVLSFQDKLEVVVQRIYQHYKGYSTIDEIRDMNIDGVSGGVSGLPESFISQVAQTGTTDYIEQVSEHKVPRACDSIWIFFQGKSIRLAFLSFGTEAELKRVCQNIYKYNNPGQLSDINGYKVNTWDKVTLIMSYKNDKPYTEFEVEKKDGTIKSYQITPLSKINEDGTETKVFGIGVGDKEIRGFLPSLKFAFTKLGSIVSTMLLIIINLFTGKLSLSALSGPVGMYTVVKSAGTFRQLLYLTSYLSINLAVINAIPFPAFDGGRVLFVIIEAIKGSKVKPEVENVFHSVGFILLMLLMVYITIQDIIRLT